MSLIRIRLSMLQWYWEKTISISGFFEAFPFCSSASILIRISTTLRQEPVPIARMVAYHYSCSGEVKDCDASADGESLTWEVGDYGC